ASTPEMVFTPVKVPQFDTIGRPPSTGGAVLGSLNGRGVDALYRRGSFLTTPPTRAPRRTTRSPATGDEVQPGNCPGGGTPVLAQSGNVALPGDAWAFLAGINKNKFNDIAVMFTRSSTSISADVMIASRKQSDPAGTMGQPIQVGASSGSTVLSGRWGDY